MTTPEWVLADWTSDLPVHRLTSLSSVLNGNSWGNMLPWGCGQVAPGLCSQGLSPGSSALSAVHHTGQKSGVTLDSSLPLPQVSIFYLLDLNLDHPYPSTLISTSVVVPSSDQGPDPQEAATTLPTLPCQASQLGLVSAPLHWPALSSALCVCRSRFLLRGILHVCPCCSLL